MAAKTRKKKLLLPVAAALGAVALGAGIWISHQGGGEPVNVYSFQHIGMTEFWGDAQESYGPVTTDKIQTAFLTNTQTVTDVAVKNGDMVKKGDVLFSFDTTLDALSLEKKRLDIEKIKVQIQAAEERLAYVRKLEPNAPAPETGFEENVNLGRQLKDDPYEISKDTAYDGSKKEKALICWLKDDTAISDAILQALNDTSKDYKNTKKEQQTSSASDTPDGEGESRTVNFEPDQTQTAQLKIQWNFSGKEPGQSEEWVDITDTGYKIDEVIARKGTETSPFLIPLNQSSHNLSNTRTHS